MTPAVLPETVLCDPDFHDGCLTGVVVRDRSTLELHCTTVDGVDHLLRLEGLDALKADNFSQGYIIFEVIVHRPPFDPELVLRAHRHSGEGKPDREDAWLPRKLDRMLRENWTLLQITSSYGCEVLAIASGEMKIVRL